MAEAPDTLAGDPPRVISEESVPEPEFVPSRYSARGVTADFDGIPERVYRDGRWELDIKLGTRADFAGTARPNTTVNGFPATFWFEGLFQSVTWTESPQRTFEVTAYLANQRVGGGYVTDWPGEMTRYELLAVAESLPSLCVPTAGTSADRRCVVFAQDGTCPPCPVVLASRYVGSDDDPRSTRRSLQCRR